MILTDIGRVAGKIWGCEGFLPKFLHTCLKNFWATCANIFS